MTKDDVHVLLYRILAYLYACVKAGETPKETDLAPDALGIPEAYRQDLLQILYDNSYIEGGLMKVMGSVVIYVDELRITLKGIEFMLENSHMREAQRFLETGNNAVTRSPHAGEEEKNAEEVDGECTLAEGHANTVCVPRGQGRE